MKLSEIIKALELLAPPSYQESYDNSGLITGNSSMDISGLMICLDSTEAVLDEAIKNRCNLVIAHHPIVFSGIKKLNGKNYVERVIIKAIKNDIAIYAIHTNLDNVYKGVNAKICDKLGLMNTKILQPGISVLHKLVTYAPISHAETVKNALFDSGAGNIGNYDECSFSITGNGTFRANEKAKPFVGEKNIRHTEQEERIEVIYESWKEKTILSGLRKAHPYDEIAFDIYPLKNVHQQTGAGMIGDLKEGMKPSAFLEYVKKQMNTSCIRYTKAAHDQISRVAVCGGSGSFLLDAAIREGAQAFISADFKYHQFFDAEGHILVADIGHFESEQFTIDLLGAYLSEKFPKFAVRLTEITTNPINYL